MLSFSWLTIALSVAVSWMRWLHGICWENHARLNSLEGLCIHTMQQESDIVQKKMMKQIVV